MKIHALRYRLNLLQAKSSGYFPDTSWGRLIGLLHQPTVAWPFEEFAKQGRQEAELYEYKTPLGLFWGLQNDSQALGGTVLEILSSVYEFGGVRVDKGAIVIDLGGNLGTFTRLALDRGAEKVVVVEAQPAYQQCLRRTFEREIAAGRVVLVGSPIWSERKTVHFSGQSLVGHIADEGIPMEAITLDEMVDELRLPRVDFIKADIEGAERHALVGARQMLERWHPRIAFCVYHYPDDPEVIGGLLRRAYTGGHTVFDSSERYVYSWA